METAPVKVGQIFEAKKPKAIGLFDPLYDDRQILYVSSSKTVVDHIDHGFNQEYLDWCKEHYLRFITSEIDQIEYENETGKLAKNIEAVWDYKVQYDSPSVKPGKNYPTITLTKFLKWAGKDITDTMPKGEWRKAK